MRVLILNPRTSGQVSIIGTELIELFGIIDRKDEQAFSDYLAKIRKHLQ